MKLEPEDSMLVPQKRARKKTQRFEYEDFEPGISSRTFFDNTHIALGEKASVGYKWFWMACMTLTSKQK